MTFIYVLALANGYNDCCLLAFGHFYIYFCCLFVVVGSPSPPMLTIEFLRHLHYTGKRKLWKLLLDCETNIISLWIRCLFFCLHSLSFSSPHSLPMKWTIEIYTKCTYERRLHCIRGNRISAPALSMRLFWAGDNANDIVAPPFTCSTIWKIEMPWMCTYELNENMWIIIFNIRFAILCVVRTISVSLPFVGCFLFDCCPVLAFH